MVIDYRQFYDIESHLFGAVRQRFVESGRLSAFDFFCIVIWKSNRSKSRIAKRLLRCGDGSLDGAVRELTSCLAQQPTARDRLRYLWETWGLRLPVASAILAVLYPETFTIYDARVCDALGDYHDLGGASSFEAVWSGYVAFTRAVVDATPDGLTLRDRDRYLWGKSFHRQLLEDIAREFNIRAKA